MKRRKKPTPIALLWTRRDQLRFTAAVERLATLAGDLTIIVRELQTEHAKRPRRKLSVERLQPAVDSGGLS